MKILPYSCEKPVDKMKFHHTLYWSEQCYLPKSSAPGSANYCVLSVCKNKAQGDGQVSFKVCWTLRESKWKTQRNCRKLRGVEAANVSVHNALHSLFLGGDSDTAFLYCCMGKRVSGIPQQEWLMFIALTLSGIFRLHHILSLS